MHGNGFLAFPIIIDEFWPLSPKIRFLHVYGEDRDKLLARNYFQVTLR